MSTGGVKILLLDTFSFLVLTTALASICTTSSHSGLDLSDILVGSLQVPHLEARAHRMGARHSGGRIPCLDMAGACLELFSMGFYHLGFRVSLGHEFQGPTDTRHNVYNILSARVLGRLHKGSSDTCKQG